MVGNRQREDTMATKATRTFETRIDIPEDAREKLVELLNARLADSFDLYSQLKQAHWNVKGPDFIQLHELYDDVAESVLEHVDEIAERATTLGGLALGTARMAAEATSLDEYPLDAVAGMDTVAVVADRLAAFGASLREAIDAAEELDDMDTADLFTEVSRAIDKHLWFVEAHLQA
jgi:starvation-inducible DNA-binding protein